DAIDWKGLPAMTAVEEPDVDDGVELADVIWQLRHELSRAMWAGEHTDLRFEAGPIELELTVAVEKATQPGVKAGLLGMDAELGGKGRVLVMEGELGGRRATTVTQRIHLTLHPRRADADGVSPLITGRAEEGER